MSALTDDQIISICNDPATPILSAPGCSNKVVRITDSLAVKFGQFVTAQEFRNQQVAQRCLNSDMVNVPTVYQFLQREDQGFIVMDYVDGIALDLESAKDMIEELAKVLDYIHQQESTKPGSLGGGPMSGVLWPEHEEVEFSETDDLQLWLDRRSPRSRRKPDIRGHVLSMCHLDFNPRNIIVVDTRIYLLDWSAAGYFPRFFEHIVYDCLPRDLGFSHLLKPLLSPLSVEELENANMVLETLRYSQFHFFPGAKTSQRACLQAVRKEI